MRQRHTVCWVDSVTRFNGHIGVLEQVDVRSLCSKDKFSLFNQVYQFVMGVMLLPMGCKKMKYL